jgi:hypothetical protein
MTEKTETGKLTVEFLQRLDKHREELPKILLDMSVLMGNVIEYVPEPSEKEIQALLGNLLEHLSGPEAGKATLDETCGQEGALCPVCPFGAFIPQEMGFSSQQQPICLPWISVTRPNLISEDD